LPRRTRRETRRKAKSGITKRDEQNLNRFKTKIDTVPAFFVFSMVSLALTFLRALRGEKLSYEVLT
jgi:hypothetical protein